uniref:Uncharacterized protein n=1 Tax=viral metagenome TaxID=1070528 RepID=A0A6M3K9Q8_9ZZZZ
MTDIIVYKKTARTGGGAGAVDGIDGATIVNGSFVFVFMSNRLYGPYIINTSGGGSENDPLILVPDANPGSIDFTLPAIIGKQEAIFEEKTISSGAVTLVGPGNYDIDTESDDATDDLESIAGLNEGEKAILRPESDARTVVVKNNSVIKLQSIDFTMNSQYDLIGIVGLGGGIVQELWRSSCGD